MLPAGNRLSLAKNFSRFKQRSQSLETPHFRLTYLPAPAPKFGFIVTTRIGKAAVRNRARRILQEVVRSRLDKIPPMEAVLIARSRIVDASFSEVLTSFDQALSKISLVR